MIRSPISNAKKTLLGVMSIVILAVCYSFVSYRQHVKNPSDTTIPNYSQLVDGIKKSVVPDHSGKIWLWEDIRASYSRLFKGLAIAVVSAVIFGMAMGHFTWLQSFCYPPLSFLSFVPSTAGLAIFFALVGTGEWLYISVIVFGAMPPLTRAIYLAASKDVEEQEIYKFITMGASTMEVIYELSYKKILPRIIGSIRLTVGPAIVTLIALEWLMSDVGFGYRLRLQGRLLNMNVCYFYLFVLGTIGFLIDQVLIRLSRKICAWFGD